jgi:hypothetical protein
MPHGGGPGADDLFDPFDVPDVRERVVLPVVASLIRPADLIFVRVGWGSVPPDDVDPADRALAAEPAARDDLRVIVRAAGSTLDVPLWQPDQDDESDTLGEAAFAFATWLEEWVDASVERGVDHRAEYVIPPRPARPATDRPCDR